MNWEKDLIDYRREKAAETLEGDYEDFVYFKEKDVEEWIIKAERYIAILEKHIEKEMQWVARDIGDKKEIDGQIQENEAAGESNS